MAARTKISLERRMVSAMDNGDRKEATHLAGLLWQERPGHPVALRALFEEHSAAKNFAAIRTLLHDVSGDDKEHPDTRYWWIELFFAEGDTSAALQLAGQIAGHHPKDADLLRELLGFVTNFHRDIPDLYTIVRHAYQHNPQSKDCLMLLAEVSQSVQDYSGALDQIESALDLYPGDRQLLELQAEYQNQIIERENTLGVNRLWGWEKGQAVENFKKLRQTEPGNSKYQVLYLVARALEIFPLFRWYFYKYNLFAYSFWGLRPFWHFLILIFFAVHFKNTPFRSDDPWFWVLEVVAVTTIIRFSVFPLFIQVLAWLELPDYHLLKRPRSFFYGLMYLGIWLAIAVYPLYQKSFYLLLAAAFPMNFLAFEARSGDFSPLEKKALWVSGCIVITLSILSFFDVIGEVFKFFIFGGIVLHVLVFGIVNFYEEKSRKRHVY